MAKSVTVKWNRAAIRSVPAAARRGLSGWGQLVQEQSQADVPYETGELAASSYVEADGLKVAVGYRDSKAAAAHENLVDQYDSGRSAKFLENAVNSTRAQGAALVAAQLRRAIGS